MTSEKATKWLGKATAKTVTATGSLTGKTVNVVKAAPGKTAGKSKSMLTAFSTGYKSVRPKLEVSDEIQELIETV